MYLISSGLSFEGVEQNSALTSRIRRADGAARGRSQVTIRELGVENPPAIYETYSRQRARQCRAPRSMFRHTSRDIGPKMFSD
jgi:hypothetical protein